MIGPTLAHVALSVPLFFAGWAAALGGWSWAGAAVVIAYWGGRELAQSFRPSDPTRLVWTWVSTRNFGVPAAVALAAAGIVEWVR
jgi:hypothetical protein